MNEAPQCMSDPQNLIIISFCEGEELYSKKWEGAWLGDLLTGVVGGGWGWLGVELSHDTSICIWNPAHPNNISMSMRITMKTKISGISVEWWWDASLWLRLAVLCHQGGEGWEVRKVVGSRWIRRMIYAKGVFCSRQSGIMFVWKSLRWCLELFCI